MSSRSDLVQHPRHVDLISSTLEQLGFQGDVSTDAAMRCTDEYIQEVLLFCEDHYIREWDLTERDSLRFFPLPPEALSSYLSSIGCPSSLAAARRPSSGAVRSQALYWIVLTAASEAHADAVRSDVERAGAFPLGMKCSAVEDVVEATGALRRRYIDDLRELQHEINRRIGLAQEECLGRAGR